MRIHRQPEHPIRPAEVLSGALDLARLRLRNVPLADEAVAALFPDFAIERERRGARTGVIAAWADTAEARRRSARAAAQGVPLVLLGEGVLRAPSRARGAWPCVTATALAMSGPSSPADCLDTGRILADRGWETPALLARAATARRALIDARVGGAWWHEGSESELPQEGVALVLLAESAVAGTDAAADETVLGAMLDSALAENPAERILILAPGVGASRLLKTQLATAAARGAFTAPPSAGRRRRGRAVGMSGPLEQLGRAGVPIGVVDLDRHAV